MSKLAPVTSWHPSPTQNIQAVTVADSHPENELLILSGIYGAEGTTNDVTELLRSKIKDARLELQVTNYEMGGDPRPTVRKTLTIPIFPAVEQAPE